MKILSIGNDKNLLDKNSNVSKRIVEYGDLVEKYTVITLAYQDNYLDLSSNIKIVAVNRSNKIVAIFKLWKVIEETLRNEEYDLITVQDVYFIGFLALKLASKYNLGLEIQVHGFEKFKGIRKLIAQYTIKRADAVRVVSQRLKKQLIQDFKVDENKITVVPVYVGAKKTNYLAYWQAGESRITDKKRDKFIFLTVGRLVPIKNIEMQIEAMANLKKKYSNIELWIVGSGPEENNLKFKIKNLKLEESVRLLGWKDDLDKFYQQANCFLLTSDSEGYGMVIIEAAKYGLPIIMTDVGCAGEFIKNNENGIIIDINDQDALEIEMSKLIENEELRVKLGNNAQRSVKNLLNKEKTLNLYKKSWKKVIKR
ncbi:glycosyltransferase family 4 protein [bacterium]|nr:glycosyltransferase family 4 protein [bacterium]